jgi:hypothetical protein
LGGSISGSISGSGSGSGDWDGEGAEPDGQTRLRNRLLAARGYTVAVVPVTEWVVIARRGAPAQEEYLRRLLVENAGWDPAGGVGGHQQSIAWHSAWTRV